MRELVSRLLSYFQGSVWAGAEVGSSHDLVPALEGQLPITIEFKSQKHANTSSVGRFFKFRTYFLGFGYVRWSTLER